LEDAIEVVASNGEQLLEEDFIMNMNIFSDIANDIPLFQEYLTYMYKEKTCHNVEGYTHSDERVVPLDLVRQQCFYPNCQEIIQSNQFSAYLATQEATTILVECTTLAKQRLNT
jgi:hypothetical protein